MVISGAVGLGDGAAGLAERPTVVAQIQACAAIGQSRLMALYDDAFDRLGCPIAQVLLTEDDFRDPVRHANLRATLDALLTLGVIPIVNENDTVSTMELDRPAESRPRERIFGDNDKLSALLMKHIDADLLVLLSDVDGFTIAILRSRERRCCAHVERGSTRILALADGGNGRGRGGMISKLESARIVLRCGQAGDHCERADAAGAGADRCGRSGGDAVCAVASDGGEVAR